MNAVALGPTRTRNLFALTTAVFLVLYIIVQCGIITGPEPEPQIHVPSVSASSSPSIDEGKPGHTHIDVASSDPSNGPSAVIAIPRADSSPLRLLMIAVVAIAAVGSVAMLFVAPASPRSPPPGTLPVRQGRAVLNKLCISRC